MREIAAVTFTEKAAAELRDRIRRELEQVATNSPPEDAADASRARAALDELDGAAVSTLHAFAQRLLSENPIEAGLPPRIDVLDDIGSQVAFEDRWMRFVDLLLDDPALERALLLALNADTGLSRPPHHRPRLQRQLGPRAGAHGSRARPAATRGWPGSSASSGACARWRARVATPTTSWPSGSAGCPRGSTASSTRPTSTSSSACSPRASPKITETAGRKDNWPSTCDVQAVRAAAIEVREHAEALTDAVTEATIRRLAWEIAQFTLREADERRQSGQLEFHDLLVLARSVLRDPQHGWDVRRRLRARYTHLLLDEFQDTDPIQCDLAALLASGDPDARDRQLERDRRRSRPSVRRRRPQAVDLPLPARRHRRVPARPFGVRRRAAPPHPQLPHRPPGDRLRQPRVPRADHRRTRIATRVRRADPDSPERAGRARPRAAGRRRARSTGCAPIRCASARRPTSPPRSPPR